MKCAAIQLFPYYVPAAVAVHLIHSAVWVLQQDDITCEPWLFITYGECFIFFYDAVFLYL